MQRRRITYIAVLVFFGVASDFYFVDVESIPGDGVDVGVGKCLRSLPWSSRSGRISRRPTTPFSVKIRAC